jgi:hypothetical protein
VTLRPLAPLLVAFALSAIGCGGPVLSMTQGRRSFTADDYPSVYEAWTRGTGEFSFQRLETILHVTATFEAWEFRWAYVMRYAEDYSLPIEERTELLRSTLADAQERHRFFVTLASTRFREGDLSDERSAWRVILVDPEGRQVAPVEITPVRRPGAVERIYFPSVSPQRLAFRIAFPTEREDGTPTIGPDQDEVILRFTGAEGRVDLRWDFAPGG